jgi:hypothetical protein
VEISYISCAKYVIVSCSIPANVLCKVCGCWLFYPRECIVTSCCSILINVHQSSVFLSNSALISSAGFCRFPPILASRRGFAASSVGGGACLVLSSWEPTGSASTDITWKDGSILGGEVGRRPKPVAIRATSCAHPPLTSTTSSKGQALPSLLFFSFQASLFLFL